MFDQWLVPSITKKSFLSCRFSNRNHLQRFKYKISNEHFHCILIPSITKKAISFLSVFGQQSSTTLQIQKFQ